MPSDGVIARRSPAIKSMAARPSSSTPAWVTLARNAACVLLNTIISAYTMSESSTTTTITSMRVKPFAICDLRFALAKTAGGTGVAPVVSGVAPETHPRDKAALHLASPDRTVPSQFRRDAGIDRRDACATRLGFNRQSAIGYFSFTARW